MIKGKSVYGDIKAMVSDAEGTLGEVRERLLALGDRIKANQAQEHDRLGKLAQVRYDQLEANAIRKGLDEVDRRVVRLLQEREGVLAKIENGLDTADKRQADLSASRDACRAEIDQALEVRDETLASVAAALQANEAFLFQRERTQRAMQQAQGAEAKAAQSEVNRVEKGKPYEDSLLFSYLWKRRYRFPAYRANSLTRALDKWVARLCDYDRAHRDYIMLLEIPVRLREHASGLEAAAQLEAEKVTALEQDAQQEAGVPQMDAALDGLHLQLAELEANLALHEKQHATLRTERADIDADRDPLSLKALALLHTHLSEEPLATLNADALRTMTDRDDIIVSEIALLRPERQALREQKDAVQQEQDAAIAKLEELEDVRRRFRKRDYDSRDSEFENDIDLGDVFGGLLRGLVTVADVMAKMKGRQRFKRRSSSPGWSWGGSGSSRGSTGGGWSGGGGSSGGSWGGSSGGGSSSSSSGGGGFVTDGGF